MHSVSQQSRRFFILLVCPERGISVYEELEGNNDVKGEGAQAANEPGQVMDDVTLLALAVLRILQQHAEPIGGVTQDNQREQEVGHTFRRPPLVISVHLWQSRAEVEH